MSGWKAFTPPQKKKFFFTKKPNTKISPTPSSSPVAAISILSTASSCHQSRKQNKCIVRRIAMCIIRRITVCSGKLWGKYQANLFVKIELHCKPSLFDKQFCMANTVILTSYITFQRIIMKYFTEVKCEFIKFIFVLL
jgi:hypothetical protein